MDRLYQWAENHPCTFIRGNKEDYWLGAMDASLFRRGSSTTGALWYAYQALRERDLAFFRSLPISQVMDVPGLPAVTICHGSPRSAKESLVPLADTTHETMEAAQTPLILCGHRHRQAAVEHAGRRAVNPGAVGVSLDGAAIAEYMLLDGVDGHWQETLLRLPYDAEAVIRQMEEEDLFSIAPCWMRATAAVLRGQGMPLPVLLKRVMALCQAGEGSCQWPEIPEIYWETACREANI